MNTPAKPPHDRKLGLMGIALTKARNPKNDTKALGDVRDELERVLIETGFCDGAPFSWVTIAIRLGLKDEIEPHYQKVNSKYGDLPLAIEVDAHRLQKADYDELKNIFRKAALMALIHAAERYKRPAHRLKALTKKDESSNDI
jgi:hypothetical protein